ncbi:MAG: TPM domain-containing protein [Acutalibacteraceae bacterium]
MGVMKKRIIALFMAVMMICISAAPAFAADEEASEITSEIPATRQLPRLVDNANLLDDFDARYLSAKLDEISKRQQMDVVIVTINSLEGKTATEYADDFYDYNDYGFGNDADGVLLLVAIDDRKWAISTCGSGIDIFTDAGQEYIVEQFKPDLSDGNYADAFETFADLCDDYITQAKTDKPYDSGNLPKGDFPFLMFLAIALTAGAIISFIVVSSMKNQLKSVRAQNNAASYSVPNSMRLTQNSDLFLYHVVTRTERPKSDDNDSGGGSSTHVSSSGTTHGGSSGSF